MGMAEGQPGVDKRQYARETGQAIQGLAGLLRLRPASKERAGARDRGRRLGAARARLPDGGFRHADRDAGGPYLADNVEMGAALLALHRSTGERKWLVAAMATGDFVAATFIDPRTGGFFASASPDATHLPKPIKQREDNVTTTRFFTLLAPIPASARYREIAEAGMGYLASPPVLDAYAFLPDVLLAEEELRNEPVHVTDRRRRRTIRAAPPSMPPRWPIRSRTSAPNGGTSARASSPIPTSTIRTIPTAPRPSPAPATSARCR